MLTPVSGVANTNGEITPQALGAATKTNFPMQKANLPRIMTVFDDHPPPRKRIRAHDLRTCTWNVRSLNKLRAISQLETVLKNYKTEIIALQEM